MPEEMTPTEPASPTTTTTVVQVTTQGVALHPEDVDEGAIRYAMRRVFGRNWETTLPGWFMMIGAVVSGLSTALDSPVVAKVAAVVASVTGAIGIIMAKSQNVTGVNKS